MAMQIGLDELLGMLVSRVEDMAVDNENQKSRFNVMFRMLYRKGLFNSDDADYDGGSIEFHRLRW